MNIGDKYTESKIYRGIRFSNGLPIIAEDLAEFSDTLSNKNNYLLDSILGSGLLKNLNILYSSSGVSIESPAILNIEGDICLIKNSTGTYLNTMQELYASTKRKGIICVIGWYQHLTSSATLREYGGVRNTILENDLIYEPLHVQVSTRYQFRWDTAVTFVEDYGDISSINITARDAAGNPIGGEYTLDNLTLKDSIFMTDPPTGMDYAIDKIYVIPLIQFETLDDTQGINSIKNVDIRRVDSKGSFIKSTEEPVGEYFEGTIWYNPDENTFKTYITDVGFVENTPRTGIIQYQYVHVATEDIEEPSDITYSMDFSSIVTDDIFTVTYEGLNLQESVDYVITRETKEITLKNFTTVSGERLVVTLTRLVEASNVTSLTSILSSHMDQRSTNVSEGHVKLSDATNSTSDVSSHIAATPKAVYESKLLKDTTTGNTYRLTISGGILSVENINTGTKSNIVTGLN